MTAAEAWTALVGAAGLTSVVAVPAMIYRVVRRGPWSWPWWAVITAAGVVLSVNGAVIDSPLSTFAMTLGVGLQGVAGGIQWESRRRRRQSATAEAFRRLRAGLVALGVHSANSDWITDAQLADILLTIIELSVITPDNKAMASLLLFGEGT